jgi:hypothetical protein
MTYHASPAFRCHAAGCTFTEVEKAVAFARRSADTYCVPFVVWAIQDGKPRMLKRFNPDRRAQPCAG